MNSPLFLAVMDHPDLSCVILYDGPLAELNSIDPMRQYAIADPEFYFMRRRLKSDPVEDLGLALEEVRQSLREKGYDGLANKRMCVGEQTLICGTPVKLVCRDA